MMLFEYPWLLLLALLPLLVRRLIPAAHHEPLAIQVPFFQALAEANDHSSPAARPRSLWRAAVLWLLWLSLVCAAMQPKWVGEPIELPASGRDLLLAVDISGSMETQDMDFNGQRLDRLTVVKYVVGEFVKRRKQDRLGLILFGTRAYLQAPLTFDRETLGTLLQEAQLGFAGEQTAIGDAVGLAIKRLQKRPDQHRVLILLTDGANTAGEVKPQKATELAKQAGVTIYTIGVGADEITLRSMFNPRGRKVNPSADLDEETLKSMAETTGGQYFRARNPAELANIYALLDELEPTEQEAETYRPEQQWFHWPLFAALLCSFVLCLPACLAVLTPPTATQ